MDGSDNMPGKKFKSGLYRSGESQARSEINWPHEFVFGGDRQTLKYEELTAAQLAQGFMATILEEHHETVKNNMLLYAINLFQDSQETNWYTARSAHKMLLKQMEKGKVDWLDTAKINAIWARYTQRAIV